MGPDDLPNDLSDDEEPRVKIHPPYIQRNPQEKGQMLISMQWKTGWKQ